MTWEKDTSVNYSDLYVLENVDNEELEDTEGSTLYIIGDSQPFLPNRDC